MAAPARRGKLGIVRWAWRAAATLPTLAVVTLPTSPW
jgi:hypothetical protein